MAEALAGKATPHATQHCLLLVWLHPHSHATVPFGPRVSSPGENGNGSELSSAQSQVWGSGPSAILSWSSPRSSAKRANPGEGLGGSPQVVSLRKGWLIQGHMLGTLAAPPWSHVTTVTLAQPKSNSAPHGAEFTHGCLCHAWRLGPAGFYGPELSRYRLCPTHPAALSRGFTIISPVPVSVSPVSPLPLYPHSLSSTFIPREPDGHPALGLLHPLGHERPFGPKSQPLSCFKQPGAGMVGAIPGTLLQPAGPGPHEALRHRVRDRL